MVILIKVVKSLIFTAQFVAFNKWFPPHESFPVIVETWFEEGT